MNKLDRIASKTRRDPSHGADGGDAEEDEKDNSDDNGEKESEQDDPTPLARLG